MIFNILFLGNLYTYIHVTKYGCIVTDEREITNDPDDDVDDTPSKVNIIIYV